MGCGASSGRHPLTPHESTVSPVKPLNTASAQLLPSVAVPHEGTKPQPLELPPSPHQDPTQPPSSPHPPSPNQAPTQPPLSPHQSGPHPPSPNQAPTQPTLSPHQSGPHPPSPLGLSPSFQRNAAHVSKCAVSLAWLTGTFLSEHPEVEGRGSEEGGLTTAQVMLQIVQPSTANTRCRYIELLLHRAARVKEADVVSAGRPFYFISHGWARPFSELLDALRTHFSSEQQRVWRPGQPVLLWGEVFVWLDIFAINQHPGENQKNDLQELKDVVADAAQTLMILDQQGQVLTRIWCLYEAWQTGRKGQGHLVMLSYRTRFESLEKMFIGLDVTKAEATCAEDVTRILNDIQKDVGIEEMCHTLKNALVDSVVAEVPPPGTRWDATVGYKLFKAARLCQLYDRQDQVEPLYRRNLEGCNEVQGPEHPDTLMCFNNLAKVLQAQGELSKAEPLYRRAMEGMKKLEGPEHPGTLVAMNNLAALLQAQDRLHEAELLYRSTFEARERVLGPDDPSTIATINNLATLLANQGKLGEAGPLFRRALEGRERTLGPDHPGTLTSVHNLASLLEKQRRPKEAEPLFRRAASTRARVLGPQNSKTVKTRLYLAALVQAQRQLDEDEPLYRGELEMRKRELGPDDPATLAAADGLATLLADQGKLGEAEPLFRRALEGRERTLGPDHPDTLSSVHNMARLLSEQGKPRDAEPLFRRAAESRARVLGSEHPQTIKSQQGLVNTFTSAET